MKMMKLTALAGIFVMLASFNTNAADIANGEKLFKQNCASCHKPTAKFIGPAIKGVSAKYNDDEYLYSFIKDSQSLISAGDERAVAVFNENGKQIMTPFTHLSDDDIADILAWAEAQEGEQKAGGTIQIQQWVAPPKKDYTPLYWKNNVGLWAIIGIAIAALCASLLMMAKVTGISEPEDLN